MNVNIGIQQINETDSSQKTLVQINQIRLKINCLKIVDANVSHAGKFPFPKACERPSQVRILHQYQAVVIRRKSHNILSMTTISFQAIYFAFAL